MARQLPLGIFALPSFDQEKRHGTRRMKSETRNASVKSRIASLAPMRVAAMGAQASDSFDDSRQPVEDLSYVVGNERIELFTIGP